MKSIIVTLLLLLLVCPTVFSQGTIKRPNKTIVVKPQHKPTKPKPSKKVNKESEEVIPELEETNIQIVDPRREVLEEIGPEVFYSQPVDNGSVVREQIQIRRSEESADNNEIFVAVEQQASFPGGQAEMMKFLANNIRYPEAAQANNVQGRVVVKFIVERDGSISDVEVVRSVDADLDREAIRVVKKMPRWEPGKNNGVAVRTWFTIPLTFRTTN